MNNILIMSDDGPDATGLTILREAVGRAFTTTAAATVIVPEQLHAGAGFGLTQHGDFDEWKKAPATEIDHAFYTLPLTPADVAHRAFLGSDEFTGRPFDLVLVGINHGVNLGMDVFHSGTFAMAMIAAYWYGCPAIAISQALPTLDPEEYRTPEISRDRFQYLEDYLPRFLRSYAGPGSGMKGLMNLNMTVERPHDLKEVPLAHYSYYRKPPTSLVPRARAEASDVSYFEQGYATLSKVELRLRPKLTM